MASSVRANFHEKALLAEKILEQIKPCLQRVRENAAMQMCAAELSKLAKENQRLKQEVGGLVKKLREMEERNGVQQYTTSSANAEMQPMAALHPVTITEENTSSVPKTKTDKKAKAKKEVKPPAGGSSEDSSAPVDVSRLLLKVGKIVDVKKHPDADSLYVETVELGEDRPRTIVSGLVKHVPIDQMRERLAVFACNLKPAKMRGILSEGMIMCASTPEKVQIIDVPAGAIPGDRISFIKFPGEADKQLNPKKKIWEALVPDLKTNDDGVATYKGCPFNIDGKGLCQAPGCPNFPIK